MYVPNKTIYFFEGWKSIGSDPEVSPVNNIIKQQTFNFVRSQYLQPSRKIVMLAGMPASSHKDTKL
jgi:hypothetical protein